MEVFASYIPVVLIVLAIIAGYWRTTMQYGDLGIKYGNIMANMATKEDIRDLKKIMANVATKKDIRNLKNTMANVATKEDIRDLKDEFRK